MSTPRPKKGARHTKAQTPQKRTVHLQLTPSKPHSEEPKHDDNNDSQFVDEDGNENENDGEGVTTLPKILIRPSVKKRKKTMYYFQHGQHIDELAPQKGGGLEWKEKWQCKWCPMMRYSLRTSSNIKRHLLDEHEIPDPEDQNQPDQAPSLLPRPKIDNAIKIDARRVKQLLVAHFAADHIPFRRIESPSFRRLLTAIYPDIERVIPKCADTLRKWTIDIFEEKKKELAAMLSKLAYPVHVSFDGWTSDSCQGLQGI